jgi:hypothetical protein
VNGAFARNFVAGFRRLPDSHAAAVASGLDEDTPHLPLEIECVKATGDPFRHERDRRRIDRWRFVQLGNRDSSVRIYGSARSEVRAHRPLREEGPDLHDEPILEFDRFAERPTNRRQDRTPDPPE